MTQRGDIISSLDTYKETTSGATTLDLRAGLEADQWQVFLFVTNLTDTAVPLRQDPAINDIYTGQSLYYWGSPRTVGINVRLGL